MIFYYDHPFEFTIDPCDVLFLDLDGMYFIDLDDDSEDSGKVITRMRISGASSFH